MIKCVVIHGSARKANTYKATRQLMESMSRLGEFEFDEIFLHDLKLPFCRGCFNCIEKDEDKCADQATISMIETKILSAEALILTSPIYILQINAETKNLLDHFAYRFHRPRFFQHKAMVLTTTAGAGAKIGTRFMKNTLLFLGFNRVHCLPITCNSDVLPDTEKLKAKINKAAMGFYEDLRSGKPKSPSLYQIAIYNAFRANAEMGRKNESCDYRYWEQTGMLRQTHFHPLGAVKRRLSNLMFWLLRKIIPA